MNSFIKVSLLILMIGGGVAFGGPITGGLRAQFDKVMAMMYPPPPPPQAPPTARQTAKLKSREQIIRLYQEELDDLVRRKKGGSVDAQDLQQRINTAKKEELEQ